MVTTSTGPVPTFRRDTEGAVYHMITQGKVAYSVPLSDLVIADYTDDGSVRGLEIVGKPKWSMDAYVAQARKASQGPMRKTRGSVPGVDKAN